MYLSQQPSGGGAASEALVRCLVCGLSSPDAGQGGRARHCPHCRSNLAFRRSRRDSPPALRLCDVTEAADDYDDI